MKQVIWSFLLFWLIPLTTGDVTVLCKLTSDQCVLPCKSRFHDIIHWYKDGIPNSVHTFYNKADNLDYQDVEFKGRTSLFPDQISQGNASLLLRMLRIKDQGRYKCYTATDTENQEQFVILKVKVSVKQVKLSLTSEGISCSTENVYPQPKISWTKDKISVDAFNTNIKENEEGLLSVNSVFTQPVQENAIYTCSISLEDESYIASFKKVDVYISSGQDATIHCPVSQKNSNDTFTLKFGESTILNYSQTSPPPNTVQWKGKTLHLEPDGTFTIHNLENSKDIGTFTCEKLTPQFSEVVFTSVQFKANLAGIILGAIAGGVCVVGIVCLVKFLIIPRMRARRYSKTNTEDSSNGQNGNSVPKNS